MSLEETIPRMLSEIQAACCVQCCDMTQKQLAKIKEEQKQLVLEGNADSNILSSATVEGTDNDGSMKIWDEKVMQKLQQIEIADNDGDEVNELLMN